MAYAALLSLTRTLENILFSGDESRVLDEELHIKYLHQKLGLFISFLEETSQKKRDLVEDLERRIRDAVHEAEDIIESHISKQILEGFEASTEDLEERRIRDPVLYGAKYKFESRIFSGSEASTEGSIRGATYETKNTRSFWKRARSLLCMCQNSNENNGEDLENRNNEEDSEKRNNEEDSEKRNNEEDSEKNNEDDSEKRNNEEESEKRNNEEDSEKRNNEDNLENRNINEEDEEDLEKRNNEEDEEDLEKRNNKEDLNNDERLKNVMEKLDSIWEEVKNIKNIEDLQIENHLTRLAAPIEVKSISEIVVNEIEEVEKMRPRNLSKSASTNTSAPMVGLEDDMFQLKELLTGSSTELETISIVGMGGIGKTTLARSIYDDPFVSRHFDIRAWTTVSRKYNVVELVMDLLKSIGNTSSRADLEELKLKLYQSLKKRRYLIIMDDVWDIDFLNKFKKVFPDDNNGSRIIMTSRSSQVANFEDYSCHIHCINFLSPKQSWNLLRHKALGEEPCPPGLEEIGWKIAEKCKGLPLALAVIGGLLYKGKKTRAHWKYVEENMKSAEAGNYDDLMEVLSWSYNHLPHYLKACFLYTAVYPEDFVIHVSHLVRLWLAEGFIKPIPAKNLEQVAQEYLDDLIARNLLMICERNYYGEIKTCTIHDLMKDFCMRKAQEKIFLHVVDNGDREFREDLYYVTVHREWSHEHDPNIRSVVFPRHAFRNRIPFHLQLLRVLDACNIILHEFPEEIQELVNLRYLALYYDGREVVASSISKLCNLQTLIVLRERWRFTGGIVYLPSEILKMPLLRHLLVDGCRFSSYPCGAANGKLQVFTGVMDFRFTGEVIQKFHDLKKLGIVYGYNIQETEWSFYCLENLVHLHQLENLKFDYVGGDDRCWPPLGGYDRCQLPLNLSFPPKLNKLTLSGCVISKKHALIIGSLPNLQVLKFKNVVFENQVWKTNEGEFSKLKFLHVGSDKLEDWEVEESHFPVLECLSLRKCVNLECIPCGIGEIQSLQNIILDECSEGVVESANDILKEQHEYGNGTFQLHVYPDKNGRGRSGICFHERYRQW